MRGEKKLNRNNFDLQYLVQFEAAKYFCENCFCLMYDIPYDYKKGVARCPICNLTYIGTERMTFDLPKFFENRNYNIKYENILEHSKTLAGTNIRYKNLFRDRG